jgi:hypothetical protein
MAPFDPPHLRCFSPQRTTQRKPCSTFDPLHGHPLLLYHPPFTEQYLILLTPCSLAPYAFPPTPIVPHIHTLIHLPAPFLVRHLVNIMPGYLLGPREGRGGIGRRYRYHFADIAVLRGDTGKTGTDTDTDTSFWREKTKSC